MYDLAVYQLKSELQLLELNKVPLWYILSLLARMVLRDLPVLHLQRAICMSHLVPTPLLRIVTKTVNQK